MGFLIPNSKAHHVSGFGNRTTTSYRHQPESQPSFPIEDSPAAVCIHKGIPEHLQMHKNIRAQLSQRRTTPGACTPPTRARTLTRSAIPLRNLHYHSYVPPYMWSKRRCPRTRGAIRFMIRDAVCSKNATGNVNGPVNTQYATRETTRSTPSFLSGGMVRAPSYGIHNL